MARVSRFTPSRSPVYTDGSVSTSAAPGPHTVVLTRGTVMTGATQEARAVLRPHEAVRLAQGLLASMPIMRMTMRLEMKGEDVLGMLDKLEQWADELEAGHG